MSGYRLDAWISGVACLCLLLRACLAASPVTWVNAGISAWCARVMYISTSDTVCTSFLHYLNALLVGVNIGLRGPIVWLTWLGGTLHGISYSMLPDAETTIDA